MPENRGELPPIDDIVTALLHNFRLRNPHCESSITICEICSLRQSIYRCEKCQKNICTVCADTYNLRWSNNPMFFCRECWRLFRPLSLNVEKIQVNAEEKVEELLKTFFGFDWDSES